MSSISSNYTDNYGGISVLKYALASDVKELIDWILLFNSPGSIEIPQTVLDNQFFDISPIQQTPLHQWSSQVSNQGKQYTNRIEARLTKDRDDIRAQLEKVGDRALVLYLVDRNGVRKILGTPESPMRQTEDYRSGQRMKDTNGYTFYFSGITPHKPPKVTIT